MTIDEAIEHAEERACGNDQCAKDHAQLADWLRELRRARMEIDLLKTLRDGFKADAQMYMAENAKLMEQVTRLQADWESERDYADQMEAKEKMAVAENAELRELLVIASDMARDYDGDRRLLRRLVQELYEDQCDECDQWKYRDRMRELGVGVKNEQT